MERLPLVKTRTPPPAEVFATKGVPTHRLEQGENDTTKGALLEQHTSSVLLLETREGVALGFLG